MSNETELRDAIINRQPLKMQAEINLQWVDEDKNSFLHLAVSVNNATAVEELLERCPKLAIAQNFLGNTPLHLAAMYNYSESANVILSKDRTFLTNSQGQTPLDVAIGFGCINVLELLKLATAPRKLSKPMAPDARPFAYYATTASAASAAPTQGTAPSLYFSFRNVSPTHLSVPSSVERDFEFDDVFGEPRTGTTHDSTDQSFESSPVTSPVTSPRVLGRYPRSSPQSTGSF